MKKAYIKSDNRKWVYDVMEEYEEFVILTRTMREGHSVSYYLHKSEVSIFEKK